MPAIDRSFYTFPLDNLQDLRPRLLHWASRHPVWCCLDSQGFHDPYGRFDVAVAAGCLAELRAPAGAAFAALQRFRAARNDWVFGHLAYDLKQETHGQPSRHPERCGFDDLYFFRPETLILASGKDLRIGLCGPDAGSRAKRLHRELLAQAVTPPVYPDSVPQWHSVLSDKEYLKAVARLQRHLQRGDAYEVNFCREWHAEVQGLDPLALYARLNELSPAPFAACYRVRDSYLFCGSPERFLRTAGEEVISQPIKGTIRRGKDHEEDERLKEELRSSPKERSENVMVVDLVRNDLSRCALPGSVEVRELFGLYSFPRVHQLITTVAARLQPGLAREALLQAAFPMGSMTGAPKHRVLQLIEAEERSRRGLFSGAVGYLSPEGDMDFNVVIRSLLYHAGTGYLSFQAGSGITIYSDPEKELEECLLKAAAMRQALSPG